MNLKILFRKDRENEEEYEICKKYFPTYTSRTAIEPNSLVLGRYSVLPYYKELEEDLAVNGSKLVNSYTQHGFIANFDWYHLVESETPKTWFDIRDIPRNENGPFVVKGRTNSKKFQWNTKMYAQDRNTLIQVISKLNDDVFIGTQGIIIRKYYPFEKLETAINELPITNEHRCFYWQNQLVDFGFYWQEIIENKELYKKLEPDFFKNGIPFANQIAKIISERVNAFVLDIAKDIYGNYKLVEINDFQQSGLSGINAEELYKKLQTTLYNESY